MGTKPYRIGKRYFKRLANALRAWRYGDVLEQYDETRWRIWTSAGLV